MISFLRTLIARTRQPAAFEYTTTFGVLEEFGLAKLPKGRGRPDEFAQLRMERARRSGGDYPTGSGR